MKLLGAAALAAIVYGSAASAQSGGQVTFRTGGETHAFSAAGTWQAAGGGLEQFRVIEISGEHPDGTTLFLKFEEADGRASEVRFVFREPDVADRIGREWIEGRDFRVTLTDLRRDGELASVAGSYSGEIVTQVRPPARAQVRGTFTVPRMQEPVYSPN